MWNHMGNRVVPSIYFSPCSAAQWSGSRAWRLPRDAEGRKLCHQTSQHINMHVAVKRLGSHESVRLREVL